MTGELLDGFTIGPHQIFPREERIVGPDATHHVEPKVMQVLVTLAANAGHTDSRNDFLEQVWSDTIVGDEVLSRAISLLRGYFKDEPKTWQVEFLWAPEAEALRQDPRFPVLLERVNLAGLIDVPPVRP